MIVMGHVPFILSYYTGWWYTYSSEKYDFVSWDHDIPNWMAKIKFMFQTTNQVSITELMRQKYTTYCYLLSRGSSPSSGMIWDNP